MDATALQLDRRLEFGMYNITSLDESAPSAAAPCWPDSYVFGAKGEYVMKVAVSIEDRIKTWRLVYDEYRRKNYAKPDPEGLWYGLHDALPNTTTFLVEKGGEPVGTLSVVFDGPLGLPAEALYADEVAALRKQGCRLCEIIGLAHNERTQSATVIKHMFRMAYVTARCLEQATDFIVTCTPGHGVYYRRQLLFEKVGGERRYEKVNTTSVFLKLNMADGEEMYRERFGGLSSDRNLHHFFLHQVPVLRSWLAAMRRPLDQDTLAKYFFDSGRFSGRAELDLVRRICERSGEDRVAAVGWGEWEDTAVEVAIPADAWAFEATVG